MKHPSKYLKSHPEKWTFAGYIRTGQKFDDVCQPGEVLSVQRPPITTHVMLYVGNDIVRERFPNSKANIYQGGYNAANVEQSWCPHLDYVDSVDARRQYFEIWRPTGGGDYYYPFIDVDAVLAGELDTGNFLLLIFMLFLYLLLTICLNVYKIHCNVFLSPVARTLTD